MSVKVPDSVVDALAEIAIQPDVLVMLSDRAQMAVSRYVARRQASATRSMDCAANQLALDLQQARSIRRRGKRKQAKYPFEMVTDARVMRDNEYTYAEIAAALFQIYGKRVHWVTVRDWTLRYNRVLR